MYKYLHDKDTVQGNRIRLKRQMVCWYHLIYFHAVSLSVSDDVTWSMNTLISWWRYQMETFSALLAFCAGNSPVTGEFPAQRPVMRRVDVFFDLNKRLNKRLSEQSWGWWFETPSRSLWRHRNVLLCINDDEDIRECVSNCTFRTFILWIWCDPFGHSYILIMVPKLRRGRDPHRKAFMATHKSPKICGAYLRHHCFGQWLVIILDPSRYHDNDLSPIGLEE